MGVNPKMSELLRDRRTRDAAEKQHLIQAVADERQTENREPVLALDASPPAREGRRAR